MNDVARNPFDDPDGSFLVLENARLELSLWPVFAPVPAGWRQVFGPASLGACTAHVEKRWQGTLHPGHLPTA